MKKALLSFLLIACAFLNELNAQCSILDITTTGIQKSQDGNGNCIVTFNMTIKAQLNGGNKAFGFIFGMRLIILFLPGIIPIQPLRQAFYQLKKR
jgi:hypothetical protein